MITSQRYASLTRRQIWIGLLLGMLCFVVYNVNLRSIGTADSSSARYLPLSFWKYATPTLEPIAELVAQGRKPPEKPGKFTTAAWMVKGSTGHLVSLYPIVTPVIIAPLYLPAVVYLNHVGWAPEQFDFVARLMEKLVASLLAAASVTILYLVLLRQCSHRMAVFLALAYGLGTTTWVISSQALWMHGLAQLLISGALWLSTSERCTPRRALGLGLVCGLIACNRQPDTLLAAGFAAYALVWARGKYRFFLAGALPPVVLVLVYNLVFVGSYMGGYHVYVDAGRTGASVTGAPEGLAALLFSPVQGLFVFSPFLLLLPLYCKRILRDSPWRLLACLLSAAVLVQILFYAVAHWTQGVSWGNRFLTDMLPILIWLLPPALKALSRLGRTAFMGAVIVSIVIEAIGAFGYTGEAHGAYLANQSAKNAAEWYGAEKKAVWAVQNTPFLSHPKWMNDLGTVLRGSIDRVSVNSNGEVVVEGWALASGRTPYDLHLLVDGTDRPASTGSFLPREDVAQFAGVSAASGWVLTFPIGDLTKGKHVFTALVRATADAQPRVLPNFEFDIGEASHPSQLKPRVPGLQGSMDVVHLNAGTTVDVSGWTLVDEQTPQKVSVLVDGEKTIASTSAFFTRPDVVQALGLTNAGGWRLTFPVEGLTAGTHRLSLMVTPVSGAPSLLKSTVEFEVPPQGPLAPPGPWSLSEAATFAARMLAHRQQDSGYWLTEHTKSTGFVDATPELNIFANAQIIDILAPVATQTDTAKLLERARGFLGAQIESTGLVRYHGNPSLTTHGTLSCKITPDADDTALIWRVAPSANEALASQAFATLRAYRTSDGLYKTWLASPDRFECIDPGTDPNPADIGIQINVLMWLHTFHPPAAKELCTALQKREQDPSLWVYYKRAPAAVLLHMDELQRIGCPLQLPPERLTTSIHNQDVWLDAIQRIRSLAASRPSTVDQAAHQQFLKALAANGFAALRKDPLLFFHNDVTASVSRYYWSQEMAYALWLRLYFANLAQSPPAALR